jgi:CPA1 family monovalent cation:H+ antiporter
MDIFVIIAILTVVAAIFGYINTRFLKLPGTIGLMTISLVFTLLIVIAGQFDHRILEVAEKMILQIDFQTVLLEVMLSFLLFAGALHTKIDQLSAQRVPIMIFATFGILLSTFLIGTSFYYIAGVFGLEMSYLHCLLFGALISPTDPIAVLGILKEAGAPKKLEVKIVGESLFNDGVGVVVFLTLFGIATKGEVDAGHIALLFLEEVGGGILLGFILGYTGYLLMGSIDDWETEVMISLALVMGGYLLASQLHFSGPLAVVVAGLFIGNRARSKAWSDETESYLDKFWELVDVFMNAILFVLIGMELLIMHYENIYLILGIIGIAIVLLSRYISISIPIGLLKRKLDFVPGTSILMTWGGLRGGISIALALSLKPEMGRDLFLNITYIIVIFSILVQGLSMKRLVQKFRPDEA